MTDNTRNTDTPDTIRPIIDWLLAQALVDFQLGDLVAGIAEQLVEAGYALHRFHVTVKVLHPIYSGTAFTWTPQRGLRRDAFERSDNVSEAWLCSPLNHMLENRLTEYRLRIHAGEGLGEHPVIRELKADGATDYLAIMTPFGDPETAIERGDGVMMSWSGRSPEGWSDGQVADLRRLQSRLALAVRLALHQTLARDVVSAYLGADAGRRVLAGQIQRGDGEDIEAVIWFSDLRSSTRLAESLGTDAFLELLNGFFECTAGAVRASDGEILDYIGDSVLAIFPFAKFGGPAEACRTALSAANLAKTRLAEVNGRRRARDAEALGFGIGLHPGTVMFGNIGIADRLKFSVIGPAANEAARVADQCRGLGEAIVVSEVFRDLAGKDERQWRALGVFELRNVNRPMALFAPA